MKAKPGKQPGGVVLEVSRKDESLFSAGMTAPFRITHILVPIDFSDCSVKALQYAVVLAQQNNARLTLVYVVPTPAYGFGEYTAVDYESIEAEMRANAKSSLARLVAEQIHGEVRSAIDVRCGSPSIEICEAAKSLPADLIVISTHGHTGVKHMLMGSVAERVVQHAPCPVLVVREHEREFLRP